ncbi:MAG: methylated-DNA--[protein]-cysteine S-methyltransferase [Rhizobacter sp.]|nr:methylated-DNA--[protein]-cysteine S-methyltransferase [Rhizobacter sp.]
MSLTLTSIQAACSAQASYESPLGTMLLARTPKGLAGAWFMRQKDHPGALNAPDRPDDPLLRRTVEHFTRYFENGHEIFDGPLDLLGTTFQRAVWNALLEIAPGRTCSYGDIARRVGLPQAVRAVGAAVGKNPLSVIVPCHRVIGSKGALTGYAGGLQRKTALLALEQKARPADSARPGLFEHAA